MQRYIDSVKLFHSVAMVCDLSPCFKVSPKTADTRPDVYSASIVRHVASPRAAQASVAREKDISQAFAKDINTTDLGRYFRSGNRHARFRNIISTWLE